MKTKNDKTVNKGSGDGKKAPYQVVTWTAEHRNKWEELDEAWVTALEDGNCELAKKIIDEMTGHCNPDLHQVFKCRHYLNTANELAEKMLDPQNKDKVFEELIGSGKLKHLNKKIVDKLEDLWRLQICLLRRLRVSELDPTGEDRMVAHYCHEEASIKILKEGMRLVSLSGANDPTEGKRFFHFVRHIIEQECRKKGKSSEGFIEYTNNHEENMLALQSSFSNRVDDLNQFRLYGRDTKEGGEGTGICLVFKMRYFNNEDGQEIPTSDSISRKDEKRAMEGCEDDDPRLPAYWVLYYDSKRDQFYYTPRQRERPFCPGGKSAKGHEISFFRKTQGNQNVIQKLLIKIKVVFAELTRLDAEKEGWDLCIYLRHLIKDAAFRDEQEIRVLKLCSYGNAEVQPINGNGALSCLYHRIIDPEYDCPLVKIIVGPKVKGFMVLRDSIRHMLANQDPFKNVEIVQSDVPLA